MMQGRLLKALVLSYADRLAAFAMPLLMLRGSSGDEVYIKIEYVIALSIVVATFADAGLRNYVLYYFGNTRDAARTTLLTARAAIFLSCVQIALLGAVVLASQALFGPGSSYAELWLGVLRGFALSIIGVTTQILIIHDRPLGGILLSLTSWLIGAIALVLPQGTPVDIIVTVFFSASFLTVLSVPVMLWRLKGAKPSREGVIYLKDAISWGWPLLLGAAATMAIPNFTRVYGISNLSTDTALALVFWMRIFSIIQLSHRAAIIIVSRSIFSSDGREIISAQVLRIYALMVLPAVALAFAVGLLAPMINVLPELQLPHLEFEILAMIGLQVTFWCLAALLEMPLTRQGRVYSVMGASALPSGLFVAFLMTAHSPGVWLLTATMALMSALQFLILAAVNFWRVGNAHV